MPPARRRPPLPSGLRRLPEAPRLRGAALLLSLTASAMSCTPASDEPPSSAQPAPSAQPAGDALRWLALGDSYTIGEGVGAAERWPSQAADRLRADGLALASPEIVAATGWTTDELAAGLDAADVGGAYDLVTLLIGVNDQYRERPAAAFRAPFRQLAARAVAFAGGDASRVVVVSIPDWGVTPFAEGRDGAEIARQLDAYNAVARDEAERAGVAFVDITPLSRTQGALVAGDGLHPSGAAYRGWADAVTPALRAALGDG